MVCLNPSLHSPKERFLENISAMREMGTYCVLVLLLETLYTLISFKEVGIIIHVLYMTKQIRIDCVTFPQDSLSDER